MNPLEKTLLVVDDEEFLREALVSEFEFAGWKVFSAASGVEGLKACEQHRPTAVLSDIRMPGGNGVEMLKSLQNKNLPVPIFFFFSAFSDFNESDLRDLGANGLVAKPFKIRNLIELFELEFNNRKSDAS